MKIKYLKKDSSGKENTNNDNSEQGNLKNDNSKKGKSEECQS